MGRSTRGFRIAALVGMLLSAGRARAQEREPDPKPDELPDPSPPTPLEWSARYEAARQLLVSGAFAEAAKEFAALESSAASPPDKALAHAQKTLADDWSSRRAVLVNAPEPGKSDAAPKPADRRSTDEIVSLYSNAVLYGVMSGLTVAALTEPSTSAARVLPSVALTAGAVGTVIALDADRGLRYGVAQSIVTGLWMGAEQGFVWTGFYDALNVGPIATGAGASIVWGAASAFAIGGGVLGATIPTTPGRSSWTGSTALWTGALAGFTTAGAIERDQAAPALAVAGIGLTAGTGIGFLTAGAVSPSIARVRIIDVSALAGGLSGFGLYLAGADQKNDQAASAATAGGLAVGLLVGWLSTSSMSRDPLRTKDSAASTTEPTLLSKLRPTLTPSPGGGAMLGTAATLD